MNNRSFSPISHYLVRLYIDLHKLFFIIPQNDQIAVSFIRSSVELERDKFSETIYGAQLGTLHLKFTEILQSWKDKGWYISKMQYIRVRCGLLLEWKVLILSYLFGQFSWSLGMTFRYGILLWHFSAHFSMSFFMRFTVYWAFWAIWDHFEAIFRPFWGENFQASGKLWPFSVYFG